MAIKTEGTIMRIGLISDIHGHVPNQVYEVFEGVDRILCAGDCELPQAIWELEYIAPTIAVLGNCDIYLNQTISLRGSVSPTLDGVRFFMTHRPEDIGTPEKGIQVIIHGHTHIPRDETRDGIRYINPGSATQPRRRTDPSVAILETNNGEIVDLTFIALDPEGLKSRR